MENLLFNYLAMGETIMKWIVSDYISGAQLIAQFNKKSEAAKEIRKEMDKIEKKIDEELIYFYIPNLAFDKKIFLYELKALAEKYKDEINPIYATEHVSPKSWKSLNCTEERRDEMETEVSLESVRFIDDICDEKYISLTEVWKDDFIEYLNGRMESLSEDENNIITLRFGLNGEPCMSYKEIMAVYPQFTLLEIMKLERSGLTNMF